MRSLRHDFGPQCYHIVRMIEGDTEDEDEPVDDGVMEDKAMCPLTFSLIVSSIFSIFFSASSLFMSSFVALRPRCFSTSYTTHTS